MNTIYIYIYIYIYQRNRYHVNIYLSKTLKQYQRDYYNSKKIRN